MPLGSSLPGKLPQSAGGNTYYVDPSNSTGAALDTNTTVQAQVRATPWRTMQHAAGAVPLAGSVVVVIGNGITVNSAGLAGVLNWTRAGDITNPVTFITETQYGVTIGGTGAGAQANGMLIGNGATVATGLRVQGFKFSTTGSMSAGINFNPASHCEVVDCLFTGVSAFGVVMKGYVSNVCTDVWVYRCRFWSNGIQTSGAGFVGSVATIHHIYCGQVGDGTETSSEGSDSCVIASCIFEPLLTPGYNIQIGSQFRNGFVVNNSFLGGSYVNVTATGNANAGHAIIVYANNATNGSVGNVMANNIFQHMPGVSVGSSSGLSAYIMGTVTNNLSFNNQHLDVSSGYGSADYPTSFGGRAYLTVTGNLTNADPLFNNVATPDVAASDDLRLQAGSPAIGAALLQYSPPEDYAGTARSATVPTLGAFEPTAAASVQQQLMMMGVGT